MIKEWNGAQYERRAKRAVIIALRMIAVMIEAEAKRLCPVDTGRLRASITYEIDETRLIARVGTNVIYAIFVEMGTIKMVARSFLRAALEVVRPKIPGILKQAYRMAA
jgi:HK97 gp10 family phage protein